MELNTSAYIRMLRGLLPRGVPWQAIAGSNFYKLLHAMAEELVRIDGAIAGSMDEADPSTTTDLLEDWERVVGIPDTCTGEVAELAADRRMQIVARLAARGGQSRKFFIDLAATLGFTITITEFDQFLAGRSRAGDALHNGAWIFAWQVNSSVEESLVEFRAGSGRAGDELRAWGDDTLECLINQRKPAHTVVIFSYT